VVLAGSTRPCRLKERGRQLAGLKIPRPSAHYRCVLDREKVRIMSSPSSAFRRRYVRRASHSFGMSVSEFVEMETGAW
jgi:hypothetical protein